MNPGQDRSRPPHPPPVAALASLVFGASARHDPASGPGTASHHRPAPTSQVLELDLSDPEQREFGDYELVERLGAGGMGVVYRARQKSLDREVAVKLLSDGPWASAAFVERFRREARAAARLEHPNIVAIHEIGSRDELNYFSMALVRGPNLVQLLERDGPMPPREAARLMRTIAEALHYAHRLGVLHLDLKPGNVLIDAQGEPQVADFGLARRIDTHLAIDAEEVSGTPSYMAPEQIQPQRARLSTATDIYGMGAILYELLTGQPPFLADTPRQTLELALNGRVRRPRRYRPGIPKDLEAICLTCLARDPDRRYSSAQALVDDLGRFLDGREVRARALNPLQRLARWARREPLVVGALSISLLAMATGLGVALVQRERAIASAAAAREQSWGTRADAALRLAREGRSFDASPLLLANLSEREAHKDRAGAGLERRRLGMLAQTGPQLIDSIATGAGGRALDIDPTGQLVATIGLDEQVRLYRVADGQRLWQTATAEHAGFRAHNLPPTRIHFSADGRYLVSATLEPPDAFLIPHGRNNVLLDASDGHVLLPPAGQFPDLLDATFAADGSHAVLRDRTGLAQFFQVDGWHARGPRISTPGLSRSWMVGDAGRFVARATPTRIELLDPGSLQPRYSHPMDAADRLSRWAAQPRGRLLALGHRSGRVELLDTVSLAVRDMRPALPARLDALAFSHDGQWLLAAGHGHIHVWDTATGVGGVLPTTRPLDVTRLQADAATGTVFALAPDDAQVWHLADLPTPSLGLGTRIAHARPVVSQFHFGSLLPRNAGAYQPAANLAASVERNGELRLWRWPDRSPLPGRASGQSSDTLYFDGRHVATVDDSIVRIIDVHDGKDAAPALAHPQPVSLAAFTPDGLSLVTVSGGELRVLDGRSGRERHRPLELADSPLRVAISPDSNLLVVTTGTYLHGHYRELASSLDLHSGRVLARDIPLPGPLAGLRYSPNSRFLVHWRESEVQVRDASSLAPIAAPARFDPELAAAGPDADATGQTRGPGAQTPVFDAAVSNDGALLTVILYGREPDKPRLVQKRLASGDVLGSQPQRFGMYSRLWPLADHYGFTICTGTEGEALWVDSQGGSRLLPQAGGFLDVAQALGPDQRQVATSAENGLMLTRLKDMQWESPPFIAQLAAGDYLNELAFATDGHSLLARSQHGRWFWWPLAEETRGTGQLARQQTHLAGELVAVGPAIAAATDPALRAQLRRTDPGPPRADPSSPPAVVELAATATPGARADQVPIDLAAAINRPVDAFDLVSQEGRRTFTAVPTGRQRLLDIDFDITGVVALRMPDAPQPSLPLPARSHAVRPPLPHIQAIHLLIAGCCPLPVNPDSAYAYLGLRYADGSRARIPILHRRQVWSFGENPGDDASVRIAWPQYSLGASNFLYAPHLENPHPQRKVVALWFESSEYFASSPVIFAATAEPLPDTAPAPARDRAPP